MFFFYLDTVPEGDIIIKYGDALDIMCVLNNNISDFYHNASQHLSFRRNNETFPSEMVCTFIIIVINFVMF